MIERTWGSTFPVGVIKFWLKNGFFPVIRTPQIWENSSQQWWHIDTDTEIQQIIWTQIRSSLEKYRKSYPLMSVPKDCGIIFSHFSRVDLDWDIKIFFEKLTFYALLCFAFYLRISGKDRTYMTQLLDSFWFA